MRNSFTGLHGAPGLHKQYTGAPGKQDKRPHCYRCGSVCTAAELAAHSEKLCPTCLESKQALDRRVYGHKQPEAQPQRILQDAAAQLRNTARYPSRESAMSKGYKPTF